MALWRLWPHGSGNGYRCRGRAACVHRRDRPWRERRSPDIWGDLFGPKAAKAARQRASCRDPACRGRARPRRRRGAREEGGREAGRQGQGSADKPAEPAAPQPSACRLALTETIAIAPSIPDIRGPGGCGGEDLVRLEAIVLPDKRQVPVKPAAILRCKMATAIADWIRTDIAPLAQTSAARSAISTISTRSNAAAATASPARSCRSTAAPTRSTCAPSSSPMAARSR